MGMANLLTGLEGAEDVISDVTQYTLAKRDPNIEGGAPISAVVAKCSNQVVGVAVVRTEQVYLHVLVVLLGQYCVVPAGDWLHQVTL